MAREKNGISIEDKKVKTLKFRVSFPNIAKPKSYNGNPPKFGLTMLFPKNADLSDMKRAVENAKIEEWGPDKKKWPTKRLRSGKVVSAINSPFRDGDREKPDMKGYPGHYFVSCTAKENNPPQVVDRDRTRLEDVERDLYAGCYARATLIAFAYDTQGNKGVSFALQNIQKLGDGERFTGKKNAEDEFDAVEDESDDPKNYEDDESDEDGGF